VLAALGLALAVLLAYHNSFDGALVLDDGDAITNNPSIRQLWPPGGIFSPPPEAGVAGRPFANFTFALNYALSGREVWSYHVFNLALHLGTALTLLAVARRTLRLPALRGRFGAAALPLATTIAGLWALHPVQTAAVDYISQRTELLMALCYALTLLGFLRYAEKPGAARGALVLGACVLGMASKEVMVTAPVAVAWFDRVFLSGSWREAWRRHGRLHLGLAATWLVLAALMLSAPVTDRGVGFGQGVAALTYAQSECRALLLYLGLAAWPNPLVFDHGWAFVRGAAAVPYALGLGAVLLATLALARRAPRAGFALAWFFLLLAPSSSVVPIIQQPVAESRMYLPLAGPLALAVLAAYAWLQARTWRIAAALALAGGALTVLRNSDYQDALTLWSDTIVKRPRNARAHTNVAVALSAAGRFDESAVHAGAAVKLQPDSPYAQTNLGAAFLQAGLVERALPHFEAAARSAPEMAVVQTNLGDALVMLGRTAEAIPHYRAALARNPAHGKAHSNLGVALQLTGQLEEAIAHGETAVRLLPENAETHYNLGNSLARAGRHAEALRSFARAVELRPDFASARYGLGQMLLRTGRAREAVAQLEIALQLQPGFAEAQQALAEAQRAAAGGQKP
jgi:tetratricopeptide (TPR) repeat protein